MEPVCRIEVAEGFSLNVECDGEGPPLVLLHGFTGSARSWQPIRSDLCRHFSVLAVDIVGHGRSDAPAALGHYTMDMAACGVVTAVERAGFRTANWLGYSMGGRLGLAVAATHPDRVDRLVLIGASPGFATAAERAARRASDEELAARIERDGIPAFVDYWENIPLFTTQRALPEETRAGIRSGRLANSAVGLANSLRGMGTGAQPPLHDALPSIEMPVLLLTGELDAKFTAIGREMAAVLPDARHEMIAGAGHAAHLECPAACFSAIRAFLLAPIAKEGLSL